MVIRIHRPFICRQQYELSQDTITRFAYRVALFSGTHLKHLKLHEVSSCFNRSIPTGNSDVLLAAVYKPPNHAWCDIDVTELLRFQNKCILTGDLNAKHPFWSSTVSNPSGEKLLQLLDVNDFKISAPQSPAHYSPAGNGDVLDIVTLTCQCL
jgi:hypothetical protein